MILKVKLIGSGKRGDPYRVNLPTYGHLHGNVTRGFAYVSIAPEHILPEDHDLSHEEVEETTEGPYYPALCEDCVGTAHAHMDERYKERKGEFRVEIV